MLCGKEGLPHLTVLQDQRFSKQSQGTDKTEKDNQTGTQKKRTRTTSQGTQTQPLLFTGLHCCSSGSHSTGRLVQDLGNWQDDHDEKDVEESQRGSGQDASACRCPLEQELLGRHPPWHNH